MGDYSKSISYSDDLVEVLKDRKDSNAFTKCFDDVSALRSSFDADLAKIQSSLQDYESKIDACKKKTEAAKYEAVSDQELSLLHKELDEERNREKLLSEELRVITNDVTDLGRTGISIQERKRDLKKLEQDELSAQKTLSMLASVTDIIPDLSDPSNVSGYIVDRFKKAVKKFEFDSTQMTDFDTCNSIWKMIDPC